MRENAATQMAPQTATMAKYAGNILPCKFPNWCLGKFLNMMIPPMKVTHKAAPQDVAKLSR
eukprot:Gb_23857 [translate_table: standard]